MSLDPVKLQSIVDRYATPEMGKVLKEESEKAKQVAVEQASQVSQVARSEVTYTKEALVAEAKKEIEAFYVGLLRRPLNEPEQETVQKLAEVIAEEVS